MRSARTGDKEVFVEAAENKQLPDSWFSEAGGIGVWRNHEMGFAERKPKSITLKRQRVTTRDIITGNWELFEIPVRNTNGRLMDEQEEKPASNSVAAIHRVRLPIFINEEEVGLGDVVKRVTYAIGITACSGCERRASSLNRWMSFHR